MDIISVRRKAEEAVADMTEGAMKIKAFEVILQSLLASGSPQEDVHAPVRLNQAPAVEAPSTFPERLDLLVDQGFLSQPRSLAEIQDKLTEHGWHYPQRNLSTPLVRMVRQRRLRRLQLAEGNKKVWKYALP
jgi:hypothetical protein